MTQEKQKSAVSVRHSALFKAECLDNTVENENGIRKSLIGEMEQIGGKLLETVWVK